jgi:hypothetical protein
MKLTEKQKNFIAKCVKFYKDNNFTFPGSGRGYFLRNHPLVCDCGLCRSDTFEKRKLKRNKRHKDKITLKKEVNESF